MSLTRIKQRRIQDCKFCIVSLRTAALESNHGSIHGHTGRFPLAILYLKQEKSRAGSRNHDDIHQNTTK